MPEGADGRFAPSPSGRLHVGNLRTALLAWLFARSADGRFLLRIEDLDRDRSRPEHERSQLADLEALGIDWDGVPIRQSERTDIYRSALENLHGQGRVYPCWCTRAEVRAAAKAPHGTLPGGAYPGICRDLTAAERADRERTEDRPPSLRLDARGERARFRDRLRGTVSGIADDLVLWRWDGTPSYNLAVVVDDAAQGVSEVVRGDDLIDSTPRQIVLQRLLGLPEPTYAHVPLVLGRDGARLAKRHAGVTLDEIDAPAALDWMAASLELAEAGEHASLDTLRERFDPDGLGREPTVWEPAAARQVSG